MSPLREKLDQDIITALKAHDAPRVSVLRLLKNALTTTEINTQKPLDAATETQVIKKQAKDRQEAIELYKQAGKPGAQAKEEAELSIIKTYLPQELPATPISQP